MRLRILAIIAVGALAAVVIIVRNAPPRRGTPVGLTESLQTTVRAWDLQQGKIIEMTNQRWSMELVEDIATGYYEDPKSGEKFAPLVKCASCGEQTPDAPFDHSPNAPEDRVRAAMRAHRCPLCGGPVYDPTGWFIAVFDVAAQKEAGVTIGQWEQTFSVDPATGYRKDPQTGKVYAPVHSCAACGRTIAAAPVPEGASEEEARKAREAYRCPFCGQPAYRER